jgi:hypothetical protein
LYSINPNKVRKDLRERIISFQNETFKVINEYWNKGYGVNQLITNNKDYLSVRGKLGSMTQVLRKKDNYIKELESKIEILSNQKALPNFNSNEKLEIIMKKTDELINEKNDNGFYGVLQDHLKFYREYIDAIRTGGTKLEQYSLNQIEQEREKTAKARDIEVNIRNEYAIMLHKIKGFISASNEIALIKPI